MTKEVQMSIMDAFSVGGRHEWNGRRKGRRKNERIRTCKVELQGQEYMKNSVMDIPWEELLGLGVIHIEKLMDR